MSIQIGEKLFTCCNEIKRDLYCGGDVYNTIGPNRKAYGFKWISFYVPDDFVIPTCENCGESYFSVERGQLLSETKPYKEAKSLAKEMESQNFKVSFQQNLDKFNVLIKNDTILITLKNVEYINLPMNLSNPKILLTTKEETKNLKKILNVDEDDIMFFSRIKVFESNNYRYQIVASDLTIEVNEKS